MIRVVEIVLDVIRGATCVAIFSLAVISAEILFVYWRVARKGGLLPQHIWLIVSSYLIFAAGAAVALFRELGEDTLSPQLVFFSLATLLGFAALSKVRSHIYERKRQGI